MQYQRTRNDHEEQATVPLRSRYSYLFGEKVMVRKMVIKSVFASEKVLFFSQLRFFFSNQILVRVNLLGKAVSCVSCVFSRSFWTRMRVPQAE